MTVPSPQTSITPPSSALPVPENNDYAYRVAAIGWTDGPENGRRIPGWSMKKHKIGIFRKYPHDTPRSVLLKVTFIGKPQINVLSSGQFSEFLYMWPLPWDRLERSRPWFAPTEFELVEKPLELADADVDLIEGLQVMTQKSSVPERLGIS
jgi:hypothetical protein